MPRRFIIRNPRRKKAEKSKKKTEIKLQESVKLLIWNILIWLLTGLNLLFLVSAVFQNLKPAGAELVTATKVKEKKILKPEIELLKVEVLNGCGVDKAAANLRDYLVDRNFDVIDFKNYKRWDIPVTIVIDRRYMDKRNAKKIANAIGVKKEQIFPQISPQRKLDVSIIIGRDYRQLKAFRQS
jgi:hypothetical protein